MTSGRAGREAVAAAETSPGPGSGIKAPPAALEHEHLGSATPERDVFGPFSHLSQLSYLCPQTSFGCAIDIYHLSSSEYIPLLQAKSVTLQCDSGRVFLQD